MTTTHPTTDLRVVDITAPAHLDARAGLGLRMHILEAVESAPALVIIDISDVEHFTPSVQAGLMEARRMVRHHGGDLRIFGLSRSVHAQHRSSGMHRITRVYTSREEALRGQSVTRPGRAAVKPRRWLSLRSEHRAA